jgi:LacI family transcriptional regulator
MKGPHRPSLRDIAHAAGVGRTTVSLALRNDPRLPAVTCQRIQAIAERLGYVANPLVSTIMATHRLAAGGAELGTLGFLTAHPTRQGWRNWTAQRHFDGALARAQQLGYRLEVFWLKEPGMTSRRMTGILQTRGIEGIIIAPLPRALGHLSLDWTRFSAAALGYTMRRPEIHRAAHHHFDGMTTALRRLKRLGHRRIGLVLAAHFDERVHHLWRAAFLIYQSQLRAADRLPVLLMRRPNRADFTRWWERYRPTVILGAEAAVVEWLRELGVRVPGEVGFAHLDWTKHLHGMTGIDQSSEAVGAAVVDLVIGQLHRGERGLPATPLVQMVAGRWVEGATVSYSEPVLKPG